MPEMQVYPNPSSDHQLVVYMGEAPLDRYSVQLIDQQGRAAFAAEKNIGQPVFSMQFPVSLSPGMYLLRISSATFSKQVKVVFK